MTRDNELCIHKIEMKTPHEVDEYSRVDEKSSAMSNFHNDHNSVT